MKKVLLLFDVDGTLSYSQRPILGENLKQLRRISQTYGGQVELGLVTGSDGKKVLKQFGLELEDMFRSSLHDGSPLVDYCFFENGLHSFCMSSGGGGVKQMSQESFKDFLGNEKYNELVDFILYEFSQIKLPVKTSNFIELRHGTLNVSPLGRACSIEEREGFAQLDGEKNIRENLRRKLMERFGDRMSLSFATGGQISIDVYPIGWDKSYCLNLIDLNEYKSVYFFGDRCGPDGNDYALYSDKRVTHPHWIHRPEEMADWLTRFDPDFAQQETAQQVYPITSSTSTQPSDPHSP